MQPTVFLPTKHLGSGYRLIRWNSRFMNHQFTSGSLKCRAFALCGDIYFLWFVLFFLFHFCAFYRQLLQEQQDFCSPTTRKRVHSERKISSDQGGMWAESAGDRLLYVYHWTEGWSLNWWRHSGWWSSGSKRAEINRCKKLVVIIWLATNSQCCFGPLARRSFLLDSCQPAPSMHSLSSIWPGLAFFSFFFPSFFVFWQRYWKLSVGMSSWIPLLHPLLPLFMSPHSFW